MRTIHKHEVPILDEFALQLPQGAQALAFQVQHDKPTMWLLVDDAAPKERRKFYVNGIGNPVTHSGHYVGTVQWAGGVWHLFAEKR